MFEFPHLPLSYLGDQYQSRQPDGSDNNIHYPDLGRSGRPYSRTLRPGLTEGAKPDPGLLFDSLLSRGSSFEPSNAGISSLFLHYSIIIANDINFTNGLDSNINDASSYLDLSPLYGSNQEQQNKVRLFKDGLLKPDTFSDIRFFMCPPGVNVLLVMYNRFHNWAAKTIAGINEKGRFTPPADLPKDKADAWRDEQLFQVTRLITIGLYVNIITHDYFRAMFNIATTDSSGDTVDGLALQDKIFNLDEALKITGNHVSVESTFLYRFYSLISPKDALWIEDLFKGLTLKETTRDISTDELLEAFTTHAKSIPEDPSQWVFGGLERSNGMFPDAGLVKILAESIEDPAGRFGPFHDPDVMRPIVMLGITQARKWQVASLNQYRKILELEPFGKFDEINTNPDITQTLAHLYRDVDNVELYPGMFTENINPESGLASQSAVVRGLLTELKALVGRDRFLTQDFTPANLTSWGYRWITPDYQILFGSKIYLLILNAFPRFIKFNSVYAMQPFFTPPRSQQILKNLGIDNLFSFGPPATVPTPLPISIETWAGYEKVVTDQPNFPVPWAPNMTSLRSFMLASDTPEAAAQKRDVKIAIYDDVNTAYKEFEDFSKNSITQLLAEKSHQLGRGPNKTFQVDFVRDIANLAAARFIAAMCYYPLNTGTPGASYTDEELYTVLGDSFIFIFADIGNPTLSWVRRRDGGGGTEQLCQVMEKRIAPLYENTSVTASTTGCPFGYGSSSARNTDSNDLLPNYGINFAKRLIATGRKLREVVEILVGLGVGMVANAGMLFSQIVDFYLQEKNAGHWEEIKRLSADNTKESDEILTRYILEGYRIANSLALLRGVSGNNVVVPGVPKPISRGNVIFLNFVGPCRDPSVFPDPLTVRLDRPMEKYSMFSFGPHNCPGRPLNLVYCRAMLKVVAGLPGLRRSPGDAGIMHTVTSSASGLTSYLSPDLSIITPLPTTMSLMWDAPA